MAVSPLKTSSEELEKEDVIEILTNPPMESVIVPPFRPKEGEIYLYDASSKPGKHVPSCSTLLHLWISSNLLQLYRHKYVYINMYNYIYIYIYIHI